MRVEFKTEGGIAHFPGLSKPVTIDGDTLPGEVAAELARLVRDARFFDLPSTVGGPAPGAADYRTYTLTVADGDRRHSVRCREPVADPRLRALVDFLQAQVRAQRGAARAREPGPDTEGQ